MEKVFELVYYFVGEFEGYTPPLSSSIILRSGRKLIPFVASSDNVYPRTSFITYGLIEIHSLEDLLSGGITEQDLVHK